MPTPPAERQAASRSVGVTRGRSAPGWVKGLAFCGFAASEALQLSERLQAFLGPLACRAVTADQLFSHAPPRDGEILLLPLRHNADPSLMWLYELRQRRVFTPVLFVHPGMAFVPNVPVEQLGAVDFIASDNVSDFELWRSLGLLQRAYQRERALLELTGELESIQTELLRRREEVGYLTYSLAGREIDEELIGDRAEERALAHVRKRIRRSERFGSPLTCFMIEIDGIEETKQRCGASFAAFVLVQVAFRLKLSLRETDFLWRYGEGVFLLLSQGTTDEAVYSQARRLIQAVAAAPLEQNGHTLVPSISIGAARYRREMTASGELIDVAKVALGAASHQGTGRFVLV